jgi:subtilase family protein
MKKSQAKTSRFILLPATQMQTTPESNPNVENFLLNLSSHVMTRSAVRLSVRKSAGEKKKDMGVKVVDSIHENGAKLVEMKEHELADFRFSYPGLRIIPEKFYRRAFIPRADVMVKTKKASVSHSVEVIIVDTNGNPVPDIDVVAFTDFANLEGANGRTRSHGRVTLNLRSKKIERMYVYPEHSYWGYFKKNFQITSGMTIKLQAIDVKYVDALRHFYDTRNWSKISNKVRVAVIDTGVGPHNDLQVTGGGNMVKGENPGDYADNGEGHGTHVAGIIGAFGGVHGLAAGVDIFSYRIFPKGKEASNFDIMKAIDRAKQDSCDLINMSLGEDGLDEGIVSSIKDAHSAGILCFAANGNEDRSPVNFPASYSLSLAVSAMGRKGTFPAGTVQSGIVHAPYGSDKQNFIADFSNVGPETDLTAPGVGIISTFPNNLYAIMDGTSMACPAAVGMAARILSTQPAILNMARNQQRADEMQKYLSTKIKSMGFGSNFEGKGMLFP